MRELRFFAEDIIKFIHNKCNGVRFGMMEIHRTASICSWSRFEHIIKCIIDHIQYIACESSFCAHFFVVVISDVLIVVVFVVVAIVDVISPATIPHFPFTTSNSLILYNIHMNSIHFN